MWGKGYLDLFAIHPQLDVSLLQPAVAFLSCLFHFNGFPFPNSALGQNLMVVDFLRQAQTLTWTLERGLKPATTFGINVRLNVVAGFSPRSGTFVNRRCPCGRMDFWLTGAGGVYGFDPRATDRDHRVDRRFARHPVVSRFRR